jgi:hypothetical protein
MIKFHLTELNREINKLKEVKRKYDYSNFLERTLRIIAKDIRKDIVSNFKRRQDYPKSSFVNSIKSKVKFKLPKSWYPPLTGKRTGNLLSAITIKGGRYLTDKTVKGIVKRGKQARMSYVVELNKDKAPYAFAQEYGVKIKPRSAQKLAIPINKKSYGKSPREFRNLVFTKHFIFQKIKGRYLPLYWRRDSVELKKRGFIDSAYKRFDITKYVDRLLSNIERFL